MSAQGVDPIADTLRNFGSARIRVQGSSMLPSLRPGDEVELRSAALHTLEIGDVVAFRRTDRLFVHRVIERNSQRQLVTRGDALPQVDPPISQQELLGKVSAVFRNGERAAHRMTLTRRTSAAIFRNSRFCAALFLKFAS